MGRRALIAFAAFVLLLLAAAWAVRMRTEELGSFVTDPLASPFADVATDGGTLPILSQAMPEFTDIEAWLNSEALTAEGLKGKVVLIDFWTYSCINCIRTLPYVTSWHEKYREKGFTVVGVHTPEFAFEKEEKNVRDAIARHGIAYPVALDNAYGTWNAYANRYWPAHYLFDAQGRLRHYHFGEGEYDEMERNIQALLEEAGQEAGLALVEPVDGPAFEKIGTRETYLGYGRMELLASPEAIARDAVRTYTAVPPYAPNRFSFSGGWRVEEERSVPSKDAKLIYRYRSAAVNLVLEALDPAGPALRVDVTLDGAPVPEALRGEHLNYGEDGSTYLLVREAKLYEIVDAGDDYGERLLELSFPEPGTAAYAFTFG